MKRILMLHLLVGFVWAACSEDKSHRSPGVITPGEEELNEGDQTNQDGTFTLLRTGVQYRAALEKSFSLTPDVLESGFIEVSSDMPNKNKFEGLADGAWLAWTRLGSLACEAYLDDLPEESRTPDHIRQLVIHPLDTEGARKASQLANTLRDEISEDRVFLQRYCTIISVNLAFL